MTEESKFKIRLKQVVIIILLALILLKSYQHFRPRDLISIIGEGSLSASEEVNIRRFWGLDSTRYDFKVENKEDIRRLTELIEAIRVRNYGNGNSVLYYKGHKDTIRFNSGKRMIEVGIYGKEHVTLTVFDHDHNYKTYKVIGDIDKSCIEDIITAKTSEIYNSNIPNDVFSLYDIYQITEDKYWDYLLPDKTHMYKKLSDRSVKDEGVNITMQYVNGPIGDRVKVIERIRDQKIEITSDSIKIDGTEVLEAPLKKGKAWKTNIPLDINGDLKSYEATVTIEEADDKTVTTRLVVSNLNEFKDLEYVRIQTYLKGFGLIYEGYNDEDGLWHETSLETVYKNPTRDFLDPKEFMKSKDLDVIEDNFEQYMGSTFTVIKDNFEIGNNLNEITVEGGEITDGKIVKDIRTGKHGDYERIVIEFNNDEVIPRYIAKYYRYPESVIFQLGGTRRFEADFPDEKQSDLIDKFYYIITLDDCEHRFGVIFKNPVEFKVSEFKEPARIVVDIKEVDEEKTEDIKTLDKVFSLRTGVYEFGEPLGHVEEYLQYEDEGKNVRMLINDDEKYYVEEGIYYSREEAEERREELKNKDRNYELFIKEIILN